MLKHIVCWKIKDQADKKENIEKMKEKLEALPEKISEIVEFEVGINIDPSDAAYDISLYSSFKDQEALATYQKHPEHVEVGKLIKEITESRVVSDYII
ncbi:Dabb family protein [Cytophagaceae bacterium ABcell3]|nr:Dabb family protein [Cytophagaceae bacterium ABcell3]